MSRLPIGHLANKVRLFILGLLFLGLLGALGLGYAAYRAHELNIAVSELPRAASLYRAQTAALHQLSDMEKSYQRYLLDGNSANISLMERDKAAVEQLVLQDAELRSDKLLQEMLNKSQAWYTQAQTLVEQRKAVPPGQGLSEEFLAHFRQSSPDLDLIDYEIKAEAAYRVSLEALTESERQTRIWFLVAALAVALVLIVAIATLAGGALRHVGSMRDAVR